MKPRMVMLTAVMTAAMASAGCLTVLGLDDEYQRNKGTRGSAGDNTGSETSTNSGEAETEAGGNLGNIETGSTEGGNINNSGGSGGANTGGGGGAGGANTGGSGGAGGANTGGSGGAGGVDRCAVAEDCPAPSNECETAVCVDGQCGVALQPSGHVISPQTEGDCRENRCDGAGLIVEAEDNADLPNDGNQCTDDLCVDGTASHPPIIPGQACNQNNGVICDGGGVCVKKPDGSPCSSAADCISGDCGTFYQDLDGDGFGTSVAVTMACSTAPSGYSPNALDCDDYANFINPNRVDVCDGWDNNCDGAIDEEYVCNPCVVGETRACLYFGGPPLGTSSMARSGASASVLGKAPGTSSSDQSSAKDVVLPANPGCQYCLLDGSGWSACAPGDCVSQ